MKYHAERAACAAADLGNAVPDDGLRPTPGTGHWPIAHGDDRGVALRERNHDRAGLHTRAAFHQQQLTALEIALRRIEQHDYLQRKIDVPIEILMQPIVVTGSVAQ